MKLTDITTDNSKRNYCTTNLVEREVKRTFRNFLFSNSVILILLVYICIKFETSNGVIVSFISLVIANLYYCFKLKNNLSIHPLNFKLSKYGPHNAVADEIQREFGRGYREIGSKVLLTQNWLLMKRFFQSEIIYLDDLIWVYSKVTTHKTNFVVTSKTYELVLNNRHGDTTSHNLDENEINTILVELKSHFPWILLGYDEKLKKTWHEKNQAMSDLVLWKRNLIVPNKPLKAFIPMERKPFFAKYRFRLGMSLVLGCLISYMNSSSDSKEAQQKSDIKISNKAKDAYVSPLVKEFTRTLLLTLDAQKLLQNANPEFITDKSVLNKRCGNSHQIGYKNRILFGCFDGRNIHVLNVKNKNFAGIVETTTSHELLHVAYHDLNSDYKKEVDALLLKTFSSIKDRDILDRLKLYKDSQMLSELHSTLGTEVIELPAKLEAHYARYFKDRNVILKFQKKSNKLINEFKFNLSKLDNKLKAEKKKISNLENVIKKQRKSLLNIKKEINSLSRSAHDDINAERLVNNYNEKVASLNSLISSLSEKSKSYNSLAKNRNKLIKNHQALVTDVFVPSKLRALTSFEDIMLK